MHRMTWLRGFLLVVALGLNLAPTSGSTTGPATQRRTIVRVSASRAVRRR
jgi:hypothetical protein